MAGDHMDWITTSPDAIRFTDSSKLFQKARNWPALLGLGEDRDGLVDLVLGHVALVGVLDLAHRFADHGHVHDADGGNVEDRGLALELGVQQLGPCVDRPADEVGADAQRIGVVDRRDERHPAGFFAVANESLPGLRRKPTVVGAVPWAMTLSGVSLPDLKMPTILS